MTAPAVLPGQTLVLEASPHQIAMLLLLADHAGKTGVMDPSTGEKFTPQLHVEMGDLVHRMASLIGARRP